MRLALLLAALLVVPVLPLAEASPLPPCSSRANPLAATNAAYVVVEPSQNRARVWQESNGLPGLQTGACHKDGTDYAADTHVADVPALFCVGTVCIL